MLEAPQKTDAKLPYEPDLNEQRQTVFKVLRHVLATSIEKFDCQRASNDDRQKWARIIVSAAQAYGTILETLEVEHLEQRLNRLESEREVNP